MNVLFVAIGAFFGSNLRFFLSKLLHKRLIGTWIANISGAIILGFMVRFQQQDLLTNWAWLLIGTGFCGAYTTFSTFGNETLQLMIHQQYKQAAFYIGTSLLVAFLAVFLILL